MDAVFEEKKHISYQKRARNDKQVEAIKKKLDTGDTQRKLEQEERAIETYFQEQQMIEQRKEQNKVKTMKMKESETKKMLDLQKKEREQQFELERYQEGIEAKAVARDINDFERVQKAKMQANEKTLKSHQDNILRQIEDKKMDAHKPTADTFLINKEQLREIEKSSRIAH